MAKNSPKCEISALGEKRKQFQQKYKGPGLPRYRQRPSLKEGKTKQGLANKLSGGKKNLGGETWRKSRKL